MIDEKTTNKNYPLPNPENRASDDVERIAAALTMIDADLSACDDKISAASGLAQKLEDDVLRIPSEFIGKIETEIKDIAAKKYIVVNPSGTGFTTVEGGGGAGGKKGEVLIKKSDENFDTTWVDPRAILKKSATVENVTDDNTLRSNSFSILADEVEIGSDDIPQQGITPHQVANSSTLDSFHGYILTDEIENEDEGLDLASKTNFGRVKVGDGFDVNNGVISVPKIPTATQETPGIIQIGEGFEVSKGVITVPEAKIAGHNNFGVVKLGDDFRVGADGELILRQINTPVIYQTRKKNVVQDGIIKLKEDCAFYRAVIAGDITFKFEIDFIQTDDIAFDLEICAEGACNINWEGNIEWDTPCIAVSSGVTKIRFEKDICNEIFRGNLVS